MLNNRSDVMNDVLQTWMIIIELQSREQVLDSLDKFFESSSLSSQICSHWDWLVSQARMTSCGMPHTSLLLQQSLLAY